jgi:hypothetical protein
LWRSTGSKSKLYKAAQAEFTDDLIHALFIKLPGRVLRGRWGSIDIGEGVLCGVRQYIGKVYARAFPATGKKLKEPAKPTIPGADEDARWREWQSTARANSSLLTQSAPFHAMVLVSKLIKAPIMHVMLWSQKAIKLHNQAEKASKAKGQSFMGPTPLSKFVCGFADKIWIEINEALSEEAERSGEQFGPLWDFLPAALHSQIRELSVSTNLVVASNWQHRILSLICDFPLRLLRILEEPAHVSSDRRKMLATQLCSYCELCLARPLSDITLKLRSFFRAAFEDMSEHGVCSADLFGTLLLMRSRMPFTTQDIEGMNSVLQIMVRAMPNLRQWMASDRLELKLGEHITPDECVGLHRRVLERQMTAEAGGHPLESLLCVIPVGLVVK